MVVESCNMTPLNSQTLTMKNSMKTLAKPAKPLWKTQARPKQEATTTLTTTTILTNKRFTLSSTPAAVVMFLWPIISGLLFSNAQYSTPLLAPQLASTSTLCDSSRLVRCQQDILRDIQQLGLNAASVQYPISQGPPYSPAAKLREQQQQQQQQQQQRLTSPGTCRLVRSNLDCVLLTTPACYENGLQSAAQSGDIALRAKRFLEQNNCNEPDTTWQVTFCYRSPEIRSCEERYGFTMFSSMLVNSTSCLSYQAFRYCVESHLRLNCKVHEIDMANEYLIDRAGDLAWRCPVTTNSSSLANLLYNPTHNPYALNNPSNVILSPSSYGSGYEQRPTFLGTKDTVRDQPWERFRNPYTSEYDTRPGLSRLPNGGGGLGGGDVFDRLVGPSTGWDTDTSDCPLKARPFVQPCEDTLRERQRLAQDARDGNELQRIICCSLVQLRDCISRVVLDRCTDLSPNAVDILMGPRRREMALTCRGFSRDLCSGALANALVNPLLLLVASLFASYAALKQQQQHHQHW